MSDNRVRTIRALGHSMFPTIPSGSALNLESAESKDIGMGEVICYLGADGSIVAHRVIEVSESAEKFYLTKGDAVPHSAWIPESAILGVVTEVNWHGVRYRTDGMVGRFCKKQWAKQDGLFVRFNFVAFASLRAVKRRLWKTRVQPSF